MKRTSPGEPAVVAFDPAVLDGIVAASSARLAELCAISSASGDAAGIRRVAEYLAAALSPHGLACEIREEPDAQGQPQPSLLARGPEAGERHLLLLGHLDTVLPAIAPRREGERLIATGALDMKGGFAMLLGALELLAATGRAAPRDLLLVAVPDEESEGFISEQAVATYSENARAVLVLEPGEAREGGKETLVAGRRGLTEWALEVRGKAAHSGLAYWQGRSALAAAADFCAEAQSYSKPGPHPTVNVGRLIGGTREFVEDLPKNYDLFGSSRQLNVIPDRARAEGEIRYLAEEDRDSLLARLDDLAEAVAAEYQVEIAFAGGRSVPPFDPKGPGAPLVERTVALAAARGFKLEVEDDRGGISFPNFLAEPGAVAVIDGLGPCGDGMHVREEFLDLASLRRRIVLLADLLATL